MLLLLRFFFLLLVRKVLLICGNVNAELCTKLVKFWRVGLSAMLRQSVKLEINVDTCGKMRVLGPQHKQKSRTF